MSKRTLQLHINCDGIAGDTLDAMLNTLASGARTELESADHGKGLLDLLEFSHTIIGSPEEEQAVVMAELHEIESEDLDDLIYDVVTSRGSQLNNRGVEGQVRELCRELGGEQVIKCFPELIVRKKKREEMAAKRRETIADDRD